MNLYIYDSYLKKYGKTLNNVEIQIHKLNLNGRIVHAESVKNLDQIIKDEINNGIKTIVAVGNNETVNKTLGAIVRSAEPGAWAGIALGIIPIGPNNSIAETCGIKNEKMAGEILLARRVEKVNIAKANNFYFLSEAYIKARGTKLNIDNFSIDPIENGEIRIINLLVNRSAQNIKSNAQDNLLDLYIYNNPKKQSFFSVDELTLENPSQKLLLDNALEVETPAKISLINQKISLIVGKDRLFGN
jgi:hypothetical protein